MATVLIIDDKEMMRDSLSLSITRAGHRAITAEHPVEGLELIRQHRPAVVITDLKMPKMDGIEFLTRIKAEQPDLPVILMTAYATISTAVQAMKIGAFDYIQKPFEGEEIQVVVDRAIAHGQLVVDNQVFRANAENAPKREMIGSSATMAEVRQRVAQAGSANATVLIQGESGTGKEIVARAIHDMSARAGRPLVAMNCAALPASLLESELFGHEKGAFTGADKQRKGRFELADQSTLLLDEISEVDMGIQAKLLRVLQERAFDRVGSSITQHVDVRVVATTNRNLGDWVRQGKFREDLFYRLNVVPIVLAPLRERREDIPELCEYFLGNIAKRDGRAKRAFEPRALELLAAYHWPGNVRELENICERSVVLENGEVIKAGTIAPWMATVTVGDPMAVLGGTTSKSGAVLEDLERQAILKVLSKHHGHRVRTATELGIGLRTLGMKLKRLKEEGVLVES